MWFSKGVVAPTSVTTLSSGMKSERQALSFGALHGFDLKEKLNEEATFEMSFHTYGITIF